MKATPQDDASNVILPQQDEQGEQASNAPPEAGTPLDAAPSTALPQQENQTAQTSTDQPEAAAMQSQSANPFFSDVENPAQLFFAHKWKEQKKELKKHSDSKTGFANLDALQPLYPGLYVIGAIPSLGKTTFMLQMGDQIAATKRPVLFFSLEQTASQLYAKSIARRIFLNDVQPFYSSTEIIMDESTAHDKQIDEYSNSVENYMNIIHADFQWTVEDIVSMVEKHEKTSERFNFLPPVVIIDYLQVISPSTVKGKVIADQRASVDHIVMTLKQLQKKYNLVVILISNLNRMNYFLPVDYESFKESGGIEYTADVMWGMNLTLFSDSDFEYRVTDLKKGTRKERTVTEKRELKDRAKDADIRHIQLKVLKNRFGRTNNSVFFTYHPAHDCFKESTRDAYDWIKRQTIFVEDDDSDSEDSAKSDNEDSVKSDKKSNTRRKKKSDVTEDDAGVSNDADL